MADFKLPALWQRLQSWEEVNTVSSREFAQAGSCTPLAGGEEGGSPSVEHNLSQTVGARNTPLGAS